MPCHPLLRGNKSQWDHKYYDGGNNEQSNNNDVSNTLASGIEVGQGINVGPGKFGKKNKCRALNTHVLCSK